MPKPPDKRFLSPRDSRTSAPAKPNQPAPQQRAPAPGQRTGAPSRPPAPPPASGVIVKAGGGTGAPATEIGWLPDCVYTGEKFESGLAFFADATGRIVRFSREAADLAAARRLAGQAALPGLVNTHSHAWQRALRGRVAIRAGQPEGWRAAEAKVLARLGPAEVYEVARMAFVEMLLSGITCVGECHELHRQADGTSYAEANMLAQEVLRAAHEVGIRIALFNGARAKSGAAAGLTPSVDQFVRETDALRDHVAKNLPGDECWIGVAPHSLETVPPDYLKALSAYAHTNRLRLHLHLGATASEAASCQTGYGKTPAALLAELGLLDKRFTALHGAHLGDEEIRTLGAARVALCACPIADLWLGEGAAPVAKLLAAGAAVALGSDAQLQTHLLEEARMVAPQITTGDAATTVFHSATVAGARSLGAPGGALEVGRPADFFTVNLYDPALAGAGPEALLGNLVFAGARRAIREVWIGARQRVSGWKHPLQSPIITRFTEVQAKLWA